MNSFKVGSWNILYSDKCIVWSNGNRYLIQLAKTYIHQDVTIISNNNNELEINAINATLKINKEKSEIKIAYSAEDIPDNA